MTPAQRMALLEQAKALMSQAEADDIQSAAPASPPAPVASSAAVRAARVTSPGAPADTTQSVAPAAITGPGGDTRVSGQPSLAATMRQVWANMKAASTPKKVS